MEQEEEPFDSPTKSMFTLLQGTIGRNAFYLMFTLCAQRLLSPLFFNSSSLPPKKMAGNFNVLTAMTHDIQSGYKDCYLTAVSVLEAYSAQIDRHESYLHAIIELAPRALLMETARRLDEERKISGIRGPMHGIPMLVKDNIDTHPDLGVESTRAGTCALKGSQPKVNSPAIDRFVKAGAIILGKANMSELMWFKRIDYLSKLPTSDIRLRPTMGIISNVGVTPLTPRSDTIGPMTKCARDVAVLLDAMVDPAATSIPAGGYVSSLSSDWSGLRIGSLDPEPWLLDDVIVKPVKGAKEQEIRETKAAYAKLKGILGSKFHDNVDFISPSESSTDANGTDHFGNILYNDFCPALNKYLEGLDNSAQERLVEAQSFHMFPEDRQKSDDYVRQKCGKEGIDKTLAQYNIDVIIGPADSLLTNIGPAAGKLYFLFELLVPTFDIISQGRL
ncbi:amidase signature domain-containing protein [Rhexocercosporidium sp. MPI-PUGE-AT-0058]|nr:amidase signature domain-containing protein [Rhexocercosporidium sp. MPI-PUGE-AT-0058]